MSARRPASLAPLLDPGWLFLLAGVTLLACTLLIPAFADLGEARWQRDRAARIEEHRLERLARYESFIRAVDRADTSVVLSLAATQLNQGPEGQALLYDTSTGPTADASVFPTLEPPPIKLPERPQARSVLERLATNDRTRLWLIAAGAICVLIGLLPASRPPEPADDPT